MDEILIEIIQLMTGGISTMAGAIGSGLNELAQSIFLTGEPGSETLSIFGGLVVVFAGISLAIGLGRLVLNWLQSFGN